MHQFSNWYLRRCSAAQWSDNFFIHRELTIIGDQLSHHIRVPSATEPILAVIMMDGEIPVIINYGIGGTFVNGERIPRFGKVLNHGDFVYFGNADESYIVHNSSLNNNLSTIDLTSDES